jgi:SAM-dependent methyltransferase
VSEADDGRDVRARWDAGAAIYDARRLRSRSRWMLLLEQMMYRDALPAPSGLRILDGGCGTGALSAWLAASHTVIGVDQSHASLVALGGRGSRAFPVQGDLARLPLRPASIDAVVSNVVIPHVADEALQAVLAEWHRVLRPGGVLIFTVFNWHDVQHFKAFPAAAGHFPSGVHYRTYTVEQCTALMAPSPFADVRVRGLGGVYSFSQPRRGLHRLSRLLGWITVPAEHVFQTKLGWFNRRGMYLVVTARKAA